MNALDAAVLAYNNMSVLRQQLKPDWWIQGQFKKNHLLKEEKSADFTSVVHLLQTSFFLIADGDLFSSMHKISFTSAPFMSS